MPLTLEAVYPLPVAARMAGLDRATARRWVDGYEYTYGGERRHSAPIIFLAQHDAPKNRDLNFEDLLTLRLVRAFKDYGLGLPTIKKAAERAAAIYGSRNPFVQRRFRSDGKSVFIDLDVRGRQRQLVNVLTDQHQLREVVEPSLFDDVVFAGDHPREWWPLGRNNSVAIAPDRQFGAPHVAGTGIRTDVVADAVVAEGGGPTAVAAVAEWYGLTLKQVADAVEAERLWRPAKAA